MTTTGLSILHAVKNINKGEKIVYLYKNVFDDARKLNI